jgi:hypothetical protein
MNRKMVKFYKILAIFRISTPSPLRMIKSLNIFTKIISIESSVIHETLSWFERYLSFLLVNFSGIYLYVTLYSVKKWFSDVNRSLRESRCVGSDKCGVYREDLFSLNSLLGATSSSVRHFDFPKIHPENHLRTLVHDEVICLGLN